MTGRDKDTPTETEEKVLRALCLLCDYGVAPKHKDVAREAGVNYYNIPHYYSRLYGKKMVEKVRDCWRPTEQGRYYAGETL